MYVFTTLLKLLFKWKGQKSGVSDDNSMKQNILPQLITTREVRIDISVVHIEATVQSTLDLRKLINLYFTN